VSISGMNEESGRHSTRKEILEVVKKMTYLREEDREKAR